MNYKRLASLISERKVIPFIGAGFSIPSHVPSWRDLTDGILGSLSQSDFEIATKLRDRVGEPDLAEIVNSLSGSENQIFDYISERINNVRIEPNEYHDLLCGIPFDTIITTNWDLLIEAAFAKNKIPYNVIHKNENVSQYNPQQKIQILKIHGTISETKSLVYRKSNYERYWKDNRLFFSLLATLMATKSILFMGYGLEDANILELLRYIKENFGTSSREHFSLVYTDKTNDNLWKNLGVETITCPGFDPIKRNYFEATSAFLKGLQDTTQTKSVSNLDRAILANSLVEKVIHSGTPKSVLYMRGTLGWLSNPEPIEDDPIYGDKIQDIEERRMTQLLMDFMNKSHVNTVRNILHIDADTSLKESYKPRHIKRRLETIKAIYNRYPNQIDIAYDTAPRFFNQMIFDDIASLVGYKTISTFGIRRVAVSKEKLAIRNEIQNFNDDYEEIVEMNRELAKANGIDTGNKKWHFNLINQILDREIAKLERIIVNDKIDINLSKGAQQFTDALLFAIDNHSASNQKREDGSTPFYIHLLRVVERLRNIANIHDYDILTAAALHDIVEDCAVTVGYIEKKFGSKIAKIVSELTKGEGLSEEDYLNQLTSCSEEAQLIKLADKWDNVNELRLKMYPTFGKISPCSYLENAQKVLNICKDSNALLSKALQNEIKLCSKNMGCL